MKIRRLGAIRVVTGSCYQLENPAGGYILMDCGLFQAGSRRNHETSLRPRANHKT
jgi:Cft2 family RNA processing exonuclease